MTKPETTSPPLFLITGISAAGKSTIGQALAERFPRSVHLRGDVFRRMIVRGQAEMNSAELSFEATTQLTLRYRQAVTAARQYLETGFTVIYQDIVLGRYLPEVLAMIPTAPLYLVVLSPSVEVVTARQGQLRVARAVTRLNLPLKCSITPSAKTRHASASGSILRR